MNYLLLKIFHHSSFELRDHNDTSTGEAPINLAAKISTHKPDCKIPKIYNSDCNNISKILI